VVFFISFFLLFSFSFSFMPPLVMLCGDAVWGNSDARGAKKRTWWILLLHFTHEKETKKTKIYFPNSG